LSVGAFLAQRVYARYSPGWALAAIFFGAYCLRPRERGMLPGGHLRALSVSAGFASLVGLCGTDLGVLPAGSSSPARLWLYSCASCVINCGCACVAQRRVNQKQFSVGWAFCPSHEPHPIYVRGRPASLSGKSASKSGALESRF
jgi:hypothetical protein